MATPQSGILPEGSPSALFLTLNLASNPGSLNQVRAGLAAIPRLTSDLASQHGGAGLLSVVGVGSTCWQELIKLPKPGGLHPFQSLSDGGRSARSTGADLFVHIRSSRPDLNFQLGNQIVKGMGPSVKVVEEVVGFRYLDNRDLTGFVDGTENPEGDDRARVALVSENDPDFEGGSYIHIQRYEHLLDEWEKLPVQDQEQVIGRTKADDVEMEDEAKPPTAHISRVDIRDEQGKKEILRHSMPYGNTQTAGLYFVSYGATPDAFEAMLAKMIQADPEGHYDHLMDYSKAVTGAAFFAPSLEFLARL